MTSSRRALTVPRVRQRCKVCERPSRERYRDVQINHVMPCTTKYVTWHDSMTVWWIGSRTHQPVSSYDRMTFDADIVRHVEIYYTAIFRENTFKVSHPCGLIMGYICGFRACLLFSTETWHLSVVFWSSFSLSFCTRRKFHSFDYPRYWPISVAATRSFPYRYHFIATSVISLYVTERGVVPARDWVIRLRTIRSKR